MNDIQTKENEYSLACVNVERQLESLNTAKANVENSKRSYMEAVTRSALTTEKLRRKKDIIIVLLETAVIILIALILLIIKPIISLGFVVIVGLIIILVRNKTKDMRELEYNARHSYFVKYEYAIPTKQALKWKKNSQVTVTPITDSFWTCQQCSTKNAKTATFCKNCGGRKPI